MIPSSCYGRPLEVWLLYNIIPILFGRRLYMVKVNEPVPISAGWTFCRVSTSNLSDSEVIHG